MSEGRFSFLLSKAATAQLTLSEVLSLSALMFWRNRTSCLILLALVFVPRSLALSGAWLQIDTTAYSLGVLLHELETFLLVWLVLQFLVLTAHLILSVMVRQMVGSSQGGRSQVPFSTLFYQGIRMWPRAALTQAVVFMGTVLLLMMSVSVMTRRYLLFPGFILLLLSLVYSFMLFCLCGSNAALYGRTGFYGLASAVQLFQGRIWKTLLWFLILYLIGTGVPFVLESLTAYLCAALSYGARYLLEFAVGTVSGVFTFYSLISGAVIFVNAVDIRSGKSV